MLSPRTFWFDSMLVRLSLLCLVLCGFSRAAAAAATLIAETPPLTPLQQQLQFRLPAGFEIQLVACEPTIGQPMNLRFDAAGRLWVTSSIEYPYPVSGDGVEARDPRWGVPALRAPRDWVTVMEGIGSDGRPDRITTFASGLNIPIGILPFGEGALVYDIPRIRYWRDTDGDGRADVAELRLGTFGNVDTHGMANALTRGFDGWIYACHGFANRSRLRASDGSEIELQSGNTFRFRPDGSHVEPFTWGQVNPFGLTFDPWGNLYSADCHSMPLTCLLRGAYYQSFGKPHDGLGFGPDMLDHNHGSTGICGPAWYAAEQFPEEYRQSMFLCNPVTGRVHHDRIVWRGSSPWVESQPDFLTCEDGWFRPVDALVGPDGALYIADFYNAIIGHYEVPLEHPRRDRQHGRIWRIVYRGPADPATGEVPAAPPGPPDLTRLSHSELLARLGDPNLAVRTLVVNLLADRCPPDELVTELGRVLESPAGARPELRASAIWLFLRTGRLDNGRVARFTVDASPLVRTHLQRALGELPKWTAAERAAAERGAGDTDPHVQRAAAEALGRHPTLETLLRVPLLRDFPDSLADRAGDTHLRHVLRIALRNHLTDPAIVTGWLETRTAFGPAWGEIALGVRSPAAVPVIVHLLRQGPDQHLRQSYLQHVARYGDAHQVEALLAMLDDGVPRPLTAQLADLSAIEQGLRERGGNALEQLQPWGLRIARALLEQSEPAGLGWTLVGGKIETAFGFEPRSVQGEADKVRLRSSFPPGETRTGVLRSDPFALPPRLQFLVAGHNGVPNQPAEPRNVVRLRDAEHDAILREVLPPRNDVAQLVDWDLADLAGRRGYIEVVDGDDRRAYAWLAVGRFSLPELNPREDSPHSQACELIASLRLTDLEPHLRALAAGDQASWAVRLAASDALLRLYPDSRAAVLLAAARFVGATERGTRYLVATIARDDETVLPLVAEVMRMATAQQQRDLAVLLASDRPGAATLLQTVEAGLASPRLLADAGLVASLRAHSLPELDQRIEQLTQGLPPASVELETLLAARRSAFQQSPAAGTTELQGPELAAARELFKKHCAACHQFDGAGARIGPQLDGIGQRGPDRLFEDLLDPSRNVDAAFRTTLLVMEDGRVLTGLVRREEGATLVLADTQGKEFSVPLDEIEMRHPSSLSLMPANFAETIPPADLARIVQYLLTSRVAPPASP